MILTRTLRLRLAFDEMGLRFTWFVCYWMRCTHLGVSLRLRKWISFQVEKKKPLYFSDEPLIMVQVAAYNASETIEAALQSLMHQTYENGIAVVYDDGFKWKPLCEFLGVSEPKMPFPTLNRLKS